MAETRAILDTPKLPVDLLEDPLDVAFQIVGRKWTVHILREAMQKEGTVRFNDLLRRIKGLNAKSLSSRLKELEKAGVLERKVLPTTPVRTEYNLTAKGWALRPILVAMAWYSLRWNPEAVLEDGRVPKDRTLWKTIEAYCGEVGNKCDWPMDSAAPRRTA